MQKLQMAALAVIVAGGALAATPREAHATYKLAPRLYCCEYRQERLGFDRILSSCCHLGGCQASASGCSGVS